MTLLPMLLTSSSLAGDNSCCGARGPLEWTRPPSQLLPLSLSSIVARAREDRVYE